MKPAPAIAPTGMLTNGSSRPATAPTPAPISTGLVEGWFIPSLAIAFTSAVMSPITSSFCSGSVIRVVLPVDQWRVSVTQALINRETGTQFLDARRNARFDLRIAGFAVLAQAVDDLGDQLADQPEFGRTEAARGRSGRAETDARGDERLFRVERYAVLVAGDRRAIESLFGVLALGAVRTQVDQHQVVVC